MKILWWHLCALWFDFWNRPHNFYRRIGGAEGARTRRANKAANIQPPHTAAQGETP